jgi:hypothetical protein
MKEYELGETCSMKIRQIFIFFGNLKGCGHLRDLDVDGDDSVKLVKKIWLRVREYSLWISVFRHMNFKPSWIR